MQNADAYTALRESMNAYYPLTDSTWEALYAITSLDTLKQGDTLCRIGDYPKDFAFIHRGLMRSFVLDENAHEYNKKFFDENTFPACIVALLTQQPSQFEVEALEETQLIRIDFQKYRKLLLQQEDLKLFQIFYLEKNWLLEKDAREIALVQTTATQRYRHFLDTYPNLESRLKQYHIASHLGITPTQLSRIRKKASTFFTKNQPM